MITTTCHFGCDFCPRGYNKEVPLAAINSGGVIDALPWGLVELWFTESGQGWSLNSTKLACFGCYESKKNTTQQTENSEIQYREARVPSKSGLLLGHLSGVGGSGYAPKQEELT